MVQVDAKSSFIFTNSSLKTEPRTLQKHIGLTPMVVRLVRTYSDVDQATFAGWRRHGEDNNLKVIIIIIKIIQQDLKLCLALHVQADSKRSMGLPMYVKLNAHINPCEAVTQGSSLVFIFNMDFSSRGNFIDDLNMPTQSSGSY